MPSGLASGHGVGNADLDEPPHAESVGVEELLNALERNVPPTTSRIRNVEQGCCWRAYCGERPMSWFLGSGKHQFPAQLHYGVRVKVWRLRQRSDVASHAVPWRTFHCLCRVVYVSPRKRSITAPGVSFPTGNSRQARPPEGRGCCSPSGCVGASHPPCVAIPRTWR